MNRSTLCTILASLRSMYNVTKWDTFLSPISEASVKALHDRWLPDIAAAARPEVILKAGNASVGCLLHAGVDQPSSAARCPGLGRGLDIVGC